MMDARMCVLRNGAKTEIIAPQNDRAMEWNVNFLLTATICIYTCMYHAHVHVHVYVHATTCTL